MRSTTAGDAVSTGEDRSAAVLVEFSPVREGVLAVEGPDPKIQIVAARGAELLVHESGQRLAWVPQNKVTFSR